MSKFNLFLATLAVLVAIAGMVFFNNNQKDYEAQLTSVQSLSLLKEQGRVEVSGFAKWCQDHKRSGESVEGCIERFRAQVEREKCMSGPAKTPAEVDLCADRAVCLQVRKVKPDQVDSCVQELQARRSPASTTPNP